MQIQDTYLVPFESDAGVVERSRCKCHRFSIKVLRPILNKLTPHITSAPAHTPRRAIPASQFTPPRINYRTWPRESVNARAPTLRLSFHPSNTATIWLKKTGRLLEPLRSIFTCISNCIS